MNIIGYDEFKKTDLYADFIKENPDVGHLKVQVFTAYGAIPVSDTKIIITKDIEEYKVIFFQGETDSSGIISDIALPSPVTVTSLTPEVVPGYTIYELTAIHQGYETLKSYSIGVLGGVNIIQYVKMLPDIDIKGVDTNVS